MESCLNLDKALLQNVQNEYKFAKKSTRINCITLAQSVNHIA